MPKITRDELRDFVVCSFKERYEVQSEVGFEPLIEVITDCLDWVGKNDNKPEVSVSYTVGGVTTRYAATNVALLVEARKALLEMENGY